jgi:putative chitinase
MTFQLTDAALKSAFPKLSPTIRAMVLTSSPPALDKYQIDSARRVAAFMGQTYHESAGFTARAEKLNYSAAGLRKTFPRHFKTDAIAASYAHQPAKIASRTYASRMGNGDEASGDGWRYRGRGFIQLTGRENYSAFARAMGMTLDQAIAYLETDAGAFMSAAWFWDRQALNGLADGWQLTAISHAINGGDNGIEDRKTLSNAALRAFT